MRTTILALAILLGSVGGAPASSDADTHARRGIALYNLGKYEEAIEAFEQAYTMVQSDALLFNLAQAHRQLEHCERALHYYKRFLEGAPSRDLAAQRAQVEDLLPKLEAACRTRFERPAGPVSAAGAAAKPQAAEPADSEQIEARAEPAVPDAFAPVIFATAGLTAGTVLSGGSAPTTGIELAAATAPRWLRGGLLGASVGVGQLWRGDVEDNALLARAVATIGYRAGFGWGRFTIAGEVGGAYFSRLDGSSGVVPGYMRAGQWAPLFRAEVGGEHDLGRALALRVELGVGACPRVGAMLAPAAQLELMLGLRYQR